MFSVVSCVSLGGALFDSPVVALVAFFTTYNFPIFLLNMEVEVRVSFCFAKHSLHAPLLHLKHEREQDSPRLK